MRCMHVDIFLLFWVKRSSEPLDTGLIMQVIHTWLRVLAEMNAA